MKLNENSAILFLLIAYVIGMYSSSYPQFAFLEQYSADIVNICGGLLVLFYVYKKNTRKPVLPTIGGLYGLSFFTEVFGSQTGMFFESRELLDGVLFNFRDVPVEIGLQWVVMAMGATSFAQVFTKSWKMPVVAASMLTGFDFLLEPGSQLLNYWDWSGGNFALHDYAAWFGLSFAMSGILKWVGLSLNSLILRVFFVVQILFFLGVKLW